ncbi:MAG: C4-type zinc ribbon domain-containing protein [SAR324 cluster bacterium]|nr:C4-type zinc ribbon domain-containing protein [SAR324 cluster bacterium]
MPEAIQPIIDLAKADRELIQIRGQLRKLDEQIGIARAEHDRQLGIVQEKEQRWEGLELQVRELRGKLELQDAFIAKLEDQVPRIRNEKEFVASKKQLEEARKHRSIIEEQVLELDIEKEGLDETLTTLRSELEVENASFQEATAELGQVREQSTGELKSLESYRTGLFDDIPDPVQRYYQRCQSSGLHQPICEVNDKSCGGCHMMLPPQLLNEMLTDPDRYRNCPHCQRLLYLEATEVAAD